MSVLCAGHVNWDVTLRVEHLPEPDGEVEVVERAQRGGGSAANVACGLAGLDTPAALFGSVGDDEMGENAREELRTVGVDTVRLRSVPGGETAIKYLIVDQNGEVMVLSNAGANEAFTAEHLTGGFDGVDEGTPTKRAGVDEGTPTKRAGVDEGTPAQKAGVDEGTPAQRAGVDEGTPTKGAGIGHLHLTSQLPETAAELAERAQEAGVPVSFDPGRRLGDRDYGEALSQTDVLLLNRREAITLVDEGMADDELVESTVIVIKLGEDGAELHGTDGVVRHGGFVIDPLDTTGAGDAFAAGFIASIQEDGGLNVADYENALKTANACGALAALVTGARADLSWERIEQFKREH
jgi:ribokinase